MGESPAQVGHSVIRVQSGNWTEGDDVLAAEEPMEIRLLTEADQWKTAQSIAITMRTPGDDFELAVGFLHGEGIIGSREDVLDVSYCLDETEEQRLNIVTVTLRPGLAVDLTRLDRHFYTTSSCGVCGKASIEAVTASAGERRITSELIVREPVLRGLPDTLRAAQAGFAETGGMHAVGLFTAEGELLASREDVGRHNAMDKLVGASLLAGELPWRDRIVLLSGRASFELLQKAMMAGAPLVAAIGAPSTLAVELAESAGITLVAFLRPGGCNVYCNPWRVAGASRES